MIKKILNLLTLLLVSLMFWLSYLRVAIVSFASSNVVKGSDVAIVLGASVWGRPSPVFRERINHAIKLYKKGNIKKIIFTGGIGDNKKYAEATVAKIYALTRGVASNDILVETISKTTIQNIQQAKKLISIHQFKTVVLVSDPLHMKRVARIANDVGIEVSSSPTTTSRYTSFSSKAKFLFRELYFYQRYLLFRI